MPRTPSLSRVLRTAIVFSCLLGNLPHSTAQTPQPAGETIVLLRHGEKPPTGLGQLTCKGLNRALALPSLLIGRYGKPDFIYACLLYTSRVFAGAYGRSIITYAAFVIPDE